MLCDGPDGCKMQINGYALSVLLANGSEKELFYWVTHRSHLLHQRNLGFSLLYFGFDRYSK
uniref:Uncharacterized protein n=1 Tax=Daucus carota subsp. sativus TaxID=79200 RepID=A0A165YD30_DAUCS